MDTFILERKKYLLANFREFSNNWTTLLMMSLGKRFLGMGLRYLLVWCGVVKPKETYSGMAGMTRMHFERMRESLWTVNMFFIYLNTYHKTDNRYISLLILIYLLEYFFDVIKL